MKVKYNFGPDDVATKLTHEQIAHRKDDMKKNHERNTLYRFQILPDIEALRYRVRKASKEEESYRKSKQAILFDCMGKSNMFLKK